MEKVMQVPLTSADAYDLLFRNLTADKSKLVGNLNVLKTAANNQILSYGDQILYPDGRYLSSAVLLNTRDIEWNVQADWVFA